LKAIIEFDLDNEQDLLSYNLCNNASKLQLCLWDFNAKLREMCKHSDNEEACKIREMLIEYLNHYKIQL
jgi:hypothetical protein